MFKKIFTSVFLTTFIMHAKAQIIIDTQSFKPFTYEEKMAPILMVQRFVNECLETLDNLAEQTSSIEPFLNKQKDPIAWKLYADCYNAIVDEYNNIAQYGTNQYTRGIISSLKTRSRNVRSTIKAAYDRKNQLAYDQYQRLQSSPGMKCSEFYADMSLDCFLNGNTPEVTYSYQ